MKCVLDPNQQGKYSAFYIFAEHADETEVLRDIASLLPKMMQDFTLEFEEIFSEYGCLEFHKKRYASAKGRLYGGLNDGFKVEP